MLHAKYQGSRPNGFWQECFHVFPNTDLCKRCEPRVGNLYKLGRGLLGGASYQIPRL